MVMYVDCLYTRNPWSSDRIVTIDHKREVGCSCTGNPPHVNSDVFIASFVALSAAFYAEFYGLQSHLSYCKVNLWLLLASCTLIAIFYTCLRLNYI